MQFWSLGIFSITPTHVFIIGGLLRLDSSFNESGLAVDQDIDVIPNGSRRVVGFVSVNDRKEGCVILASVTEKNGIGLDTK